jgi:hypothetical protein
MLLLGRGAVGDAGWLQRYNRAVEALLGDASVRVGGPPPLLPPLPRG